MLEENTNRPGKTSSDRASRAWGKFIPLKINIMLSKIQGCGKSHFTSVISTHKNIQTWYKLNVIANLK